MTKPQPERKPVRWWHFLHEWSRYVPLPSYPNIQVSTCEICGKQRHYHISNNY